MQQNNTFARILREVVTSLPGADGAIFVDWEGECVDGFSRVGDTNLRITGAQWGVAYYLARSVLQKQALGSLTEMVLRFERQQIVIRRITEDYLVILALRREAGLGEALHRLRLAETDLRREM